MKFKSEIKENILFIRLEGDLIASPDSQALYNFVEENINESTLLCAIDLSNVRFINSSGIGVLVSLLTKFRNRGGELILIKPSDHIRKLLIITKLNAIFTIAENDTFAAQLLKESI
ncbi:MAG: STAS domain-containing protein [Hymenobacteraceae bacterium]|nr:STAS domain-containing protein [Hymenobacteraceae bacterium]MDX5394988.1 STAS domain-containing protein [Hymenobacteraceae bacterium]MDX5443813.1 STAS domain-containing protein [Hymenobacteraceae bacterium]MDX5511021.1 STAS domain-containing protein [Hymenobacteraceae bacterium]